MVSGKKPTGRTTTWVLQLVLLQLQLFMISQHEHLSEACFLQPHRRFLTWQTGINALLLSSLLAAVAVPVPCFILTVMEKFSPSLHRQLSGREPMSTPMTQLCGQYTSTHDQTTNSYSGCSLSPCTALKSGALGRASDSCA